MNEHFKVSSRLILNIGRNSIKDHTTALLELVKNSYDADARQVLIEINTKHTTPFISVTDNGIGMSHEELTKNWLYIGYSEKRTNKVSPGGRRKTGEKGIGRMSADRLGAKLVLKTKSAGYASVGVDICWDLFDVEDKHIENIELNMLTEQAAEFSLLPASSTGTNLVITELRQTWRRCDIEELIQEISIFLPPFENVQEFSVLLTNDIDPSLNGLIQSPVLELAEIDMIATLESGVVTYEFEDKISGETFKTPGQRIDWESLIQKVNNDSVFEGNHYDIDHLGKVKLRLLFYLRDSQNVLDSSLSLSDLRGFLNLNAGVKVYRDNVLVKPYGTKKPEGDWLGLAERKTRDPAGISRPSWRVAANQIVGATFIGRDSNPDLIDSGGREGLLNNDAFYALKTFVLGALILLENHRFERTNDQKVVLKEDVVDPKAAIEVLSTGLSSLRSDLNKVAKEIPRGKSRHFDKTIDKVAAIEQGIKKTTKLLEDLMNREQVLRGLATIGISSAVFGHEVQQPISEVKTAIIATREALLINPPKTDIAQSEVNKAIESATKIASWGVFALSRVQRDNRKKTKINLKDNIEKILKQTKPFYAISNIEVIPDLHDVSTKVFALDIDSILLNLLTNSYHACLVKGGKRTIKVTLKPEDRVKKGYVIVVSDSGHGVDQRFISNVWEPLFTTKVDNQGSKIGTGLGLYIVQSIVKEYDGDKTIDIDPELGGARFTIWLPIR